MILHASIIVKQFIYMDILGCVIFIFEVARMTVMFAPMLSTLFIGDRMRALQLAPHLIKATDGTNPVTAGPQTRVQDGIHLATWSVFVR